MDQIVAREHEINELEKIYAKDEPAFLAVYGRRRVGKTFLINRFFRNKGIYLEVSGAKDAKTSVQLQNFAVDFANCFAKGEKQRPPADWHDAFMLLRKQIETIDESKKVILFFDELPWIATPKSGFMQALDYFWNRYFSRRPNAILIICGSAASWMIRRVINDKGGLYGRLTKEMPLYPLDLRETESYLQARNIHLDRKQIIEIYMAIGGIPKYLNYVERGKSSAQVINEACFSSDSPLLSEFHKLYQSLFHNYQRHVQIVRVLASASEGLSYEDLLTRVGISSGGTASLLLNELEASGFITYYPMFGKRRKKGKYRLTDEYSLFYLTWIEPLPKTGLRNARVNYWVKKQSTQAWASWSGHAYEGICLKHIGKIKQALGLAAVSTEAWTWFEKEAQIDLVIDRADSCINMCEVKFYKTKFRIDKAYAKVLENKKHQFRLATQTRKALFTTLITTYGTIENDHYIGVVDNQLTMEDLF